MGWIRLCRDINEHWIWKYDHRFKWWIDILLTVNYADNKVLVGNNLIDCKRGQSVMSLNNWAERWGVSRKAVKDFFELLQQDSMLVYEGLHVTTRITVCNYEKYQGEVNTEEPQKNRAGTEQEPQKNRAGTEQEHNMIKKRNKEIKKEENINPPPLSFVASSFLPVWEKWLAYRKEIKKPYRTETGMKTKYNELVSLSGNDAAKALLIVEQSIGNEWTGFFALKTNGNRVKNSVPVEDPVDRMIREQKEYFQLHPITEKNGFTK
jgi:hypothetical protein